MPAGAVLVYPEGATIDKVVSPGGPTIYPVPPEIDLPVRQGGRPVDGLPRVVPAGRPLGFDLKSNPDGRGLVIPAKAKRLVPGSSWGDVHDRLYRPDRAVRRLVHVPVPKGEGGRGVAHRRGGRARGDVRRVARPRLAVRAVLPALPRVDDRRDRRLRVRRVGVARLAPALPARLPFELPQDRHDRPSGLRRHPRQPRAPRAGGESPVRPRRRAVLRRPDFPLRLHLHHVRRDLRVSTPSSRRARRRRWSTARATSE